MPFMYSSTFSLYSGLSKMLIGKTALVEAVLEVFEFEPEKDIKVVLY